MTFLLDSSLFVIRKKPIKAHVEINPKNCIENKYFYNSNFSPTVA